MAKLLPLERRSAVTRLVWVLTVVVTTATLADGAALSTLLSSIVRFDGGTVHAADHYKFAPIPCQYLEAENVTCAQCSWGIGGSCPYLFGYDGSDAPPIPDTCSPGLPGTDRGGGDYRTQELPTDSVADCRALCCTEDQCNAWVYVPSAPSNFLQCHTGSHCCYLKSSTPAPTNSSLPGIVSGTATWPAQNLTHPPLGLRSAVPLGGLGAGAVELRADGTFHEWTLTNQHPAGAAKFGVVGDALVGLHVGGGTARALRTSPPAGSGIPGVESLTYHGSYPVSELEARDPALTAVGCNATLYAYSVLKPGDAVASGIPAIVFSLSVTNTGTAKLANVSLLVSLPLGGFNDCSRAGSGSGSNTPLGTAASAAACLAACNTALPSTCAAWTYTAHTGACVGSSAVAHSVFVDGGACGVRGAWKQVQPDTGALTLETAPASGHAAAGQATLMPVVGGNSSSSSTVGVGGSAADVWAAWVAGRGAFAPSDGPGAGGRPAVQGAVSVTTTAPLAPGDTVVLSAVFAWYFPGECGAKHATNRFLRRHDVERRRKLLCFCRRNRHGEDHLYVAPYRYRRVSLLTHNHPICYM